MEDDDILFEAIVEADEFEYEEREKTSVFGVMGPAVAAQPSETEAKDKAQQASVTQWALGGNGRYTPVGSTVPKLPAGIYEPFATSGSWGVERLNIASDGIYTLPDMATEEVLAEVGKFWDSETKYRDHGLLYKRGIILFGPPGGGKTVTVKLLMNEIVRRDGVVIVAQNINLVILCLKAIRRIEPERNLIVVLEDIDEIIAHNGESVVLSMLDGENNIDNVLHLATTNYPERLGARIINRPSRFDRRVKVGLPSDDARAAYLTHVTKGAVVGDVLAKWVEDTKDMSVAHLRELVASVHCLDQDYEDVVARLKEMAKQAQSGDDFKKNTPGFRGKSEPSVSAWN